MALVCGLRGLRFDPGHATATKCGKKWEKLMTNKSVSVIRTYWHFVYPDGTRVPISRKGYAQFLALSRSNREVAESGFSVTAETYTLEFPACAHCKVRPVATDFDCDGTYLLSVCDHPLCVRGRSIAYEGLSKESSETIREFFR